jgi:hypothetical protein
MVILLQWGILLGITAGIGLLLMATNLWGMWQNRRYRRSGEMIAAEAEQWLAQEGDQRDL